MRRSHRIGTATAVTLAFFSPQTSVGQGTDTSTGLGQDRREGGTQRAVVHVGAGTTSASTTGYSGQRDPSSSPSNNIELPPPPDAGLCEAYKNKPGYEACLGIVLAEETRAQR